MKRVLAILALAVLGTGCATITKGTTQVVALDTPGHPGAQCTLNSPGFGTRQVTTPANVTLEKTRHNISVTCARGCFRGTGIISSGLEAMTAGNVVAGGVIGLGVDAASGAMNRYSEHNQVSLTRQPGCVG